MGTRGPAPKRTEQRRRTNAPPVPVDKAPAGAKGAVKAPAANRKWHPVARRWYESLSKSGQSKFYEASDWAAAWVIAESMSRELNPRPMSVGKGDSARVELVEQSPGASTVAAWLKGMSMLLATEGDRRRALLELVRPPAPAAEGGVGNVSWIDDARKRLGGSG